MKKYLIVILILTLIFCTACKQKEQRETTATQMIEQTSVPSVEIQPAVIPSVTEMINSGTPDPAATIWPELTWAEPGEYIPDRIRDEETSSNSNDILYEDEQYIYYLKSFQGDLVYIRKSDGEVKIISSDCRGFTVYNGKVYYVDRDGDGSGNITTR